MIKIKAVCIIGSQRNNGNTALVVDKIIEGMEKAGIAVNRYVLGYLNINYCEDCNYCQSMKRCKQYDDMNAIYEDIDESDIILVASPTYLGDITGHLKVFFDRCRPYLNDKIAMRGGKCGISVAIESNNLKNSHAIDTIEYFYKQLGIMPIEKFTMKSIHLDDNRQEELERAYEIGYNVKEAINKSLLTSRIVEA
ncbi:flavodoxin family protein [Clostridiaceae bacterium M8S5]|nr:flavodoxin family protein [Clostridiaceae bacterium M8S5]